MVTDIVIPVRGNLHYTQNVINQIQSMSGWSHCWIFDNEGLESETWDWWKFNRPRRTSMIPASGLSIYEMWNEGWFVSRFADHVLFLNNDITLQPRTITALNDALESQEDHWIAYPDYNWRGETMQHLCNYKYTKGTYRHGGMSGYCFMLHRKRIPWSPLVDPSFKLWYGDDDIAFQVAAHDGKQVRVVGLPIEHVGSATVNQHPELHGFIPQDRARFIEKWGNH